MNLELGALELHIGGWTEDVVMNNNSYYIKVNMSASYISAM